MKRKHLKFFSQLLMASFLFIACSSNDDIPDEPIQTESDCLRIGDSYQGGIIFYIDHTNEHGLIAALSDQSDAAIWGCEDAIVEIAIYRDIGHGQENTIAIVNNCSENNTAAKICSELSLNGYSDWFLPSLHELELLYHHKNLVGGFAEALYASSSEMGSMDGPYDTVCAMDFTPNPNHPDRHAFIPKSTPTHVRAIRKF